MGATRRTLEGFWLRAKTAFIPRNMPRLHCVGMVRNEIDILDIWLDHLEAIFDDILIYDHLSTDGTRERLQARASRSSKLTVRSFDEPGLRKAQLMSAALLERRAQGTNGWVFFLDADEFIHGQDAAALRRNLIRHRGAKSVEFRWINAYVTALTMPLSRNSQLRGWHSDAPPKVAVNLRHVTDRSHIQQGNHRLIIEGEKRHLAPRAGWLLHIPVRSIAQLRRKIDNGLNATRLVDTEGAYSLHWRYMEGRLSPGRQPFIPALVYHYGSKAQLRQERSCEQPPPPETMEGRLTHLILVAPPVSEPVYFSAVPAQAAMAVSMSVSTE